MPATFLHRLLDLFVGLFRASMLGYGGGPASIPLLEAEAVEHYHWLTPDEFATLLAAGNALPGPILTKMAGYIGYHVAGWVGALVGLITVVLPTALLLIGLLGLLQRFSESPVVAGMLKGVRPVVWVLFISLAIDYLAFVKTPPAILIAGAALAGIYLLHLHPAVLVAGALVVGAVFLR
ncbi:chromate transporter [Limnochorda pilosa]|uniref:Chromate transporter n=1 Tax=Limnochorda pilosa TaxID=1555112 RepID=A0A0K2SGA3_LIMPI|nr:chromate transporter [Limnochorda pilosa]BAS26131.1 chromate transporter [Limnochorda pilosa]